MSRDARKASVEAAFPFGDLDWPRRVVPGPDPFIEEERDRLLEYFLRKRWRVGRYQGRYQARPHFPILPFSSRSFTRASPVRSGGDQS